MDKEPLLSIFLSLVLCTGLLAGVVRVGFSQDSSYLWSRVYGGTGDDEAHCIIRTSDGGYAIAGWTNSFGLPGYRGWLVKTDASGQMMWNKTYGDPYESVIWSVIQTSDGGYALAGSSVRPVPILVGSVPKGVPWLVKTDSSGNVVWEQAYTDLIGINGQAGAHCIIERPSGGFVLGGQYQSTTTSLVLFVAAFWVVTDTSGNITNGHIYGEEYGFLPWESTIESIIYSGDGGYFLAGGWVTSWLYAYPAGDGGMTLWKIDGNGNLVWGPIRDSSNYKYGGTEAYSLTRGNDGSLLLAGYTSEWDWSILAYRDYPYIVRVDSSGNQSAGSEKKPDTNEGCATAVIKTSDGGYVLAGYGKLSSGSGYGIWLQKMDSVENPKWTDSFDYSGDEKAYSMVSTTTGDFIVAGSTNSIGAGSEDFLIVDFGSPTTTPHGPKADFTVSPETANVGQLVTFDAMTSQPGWNGTNQMPVTKYSWDFGDGNKTDTTTPIIYHAFGSSGIYYPSLTVKASGATPETDTITKRVLIISTPVGGYSVSLASFKGHNTALPSSFYFTIVTMLAVVLTAIRRKKRRK